MLIPQITSAPVCVLACLCHRSRSISGASSGLSTSPLSSPRVSHDPQNLFKYTHTTHSHIQHTPLDPVLRYPLSGITTIQLLLIPCYCCLLIAVYVSKRKTTASLQEFLTFNEAQQPHHESNITVSLCKCNIVLLIHYIVSLRYGIVFHYLC